MAHWTGGTLGLYLPRLRQLTGSTPIRDVGLLASEGRFSIPLIDASPAGAADVTSSFLEFIPAEHEAAGQVGTFGIHELESGREYFLVLTNFAGLWRYNIQDRIRVLGWMGHTPLIEFLSKGAHTANITGEKLTENQLVEAVAHACAATGIEVQNFVAQGHFAPLPYYQLQVQCGTAALGCAHSSREELDKLARTVDDSLGKLNVEYASKRRSGRLGPINIVPVGPEYFAHQEQQFLARRGPRLEQYKPRFLLTEVVPDAPQEQASS